MENERKRTKHLFYPYRTPRDNCHSCDSCGVASSGSEFGAGERTDDRLCRRLADPVLLRFRRLLHPRIAGIQQTEGGRLHQEVFRCLLQLGSAHQLFHNLLRQLFHQRRRPILDALPGGRPSQLGNLERETGIRTGVSRRNRLSGVLHSHQSAETGFERGDVF